MRNFAEEIVWIVALALSVSVFAAGEKKRLLTEKELVDRATRFVIEDLEELPPVEGHLDYTQVPTILADAAKRMAADLLQRGYSKESAIDASLAATAQVDPVRNQCSFVTDPEHKAIESYPPPEPESRMPESEHIKEIREKFHIKGKVFPIKGDICTDGTVNIDKLDAYRDQLSKELTPVAQTRNPVPKDKKPDADSAVSPPAQKTPDPYIAQTYPVPFSSAPTLGPLIGSGPILTFNETLPGHKAPSAPSVASNSRDPNDPTPAQNLEIIRQALQQKVLQREISPVAADAFLTKLAPALQQEPDLNKALQMAQVQLNASPVPRPRSQASVASRELQSGSLPKPSSAIEPTKAANIAAGTATSPGGTVSYFGFLGAAPVGTAPTDAEMKKSGDNLASSLAAALSKKNALPDLGPQVDGPDGGGSGTNTSSGGTLANLAAGGLFNTPPPQEAEKKQSAFRSFIDRISQAIGEPSRLPASERKKLAGFEHFQESAALALASVGNTGEMRLHPSLSPWLPVLFFLTPFSLILVGFALWKWRKQKAKQSRSA